MQGLNTGSFFNKHQSVMGGTKQSLGLMRPNTTTEQKVDEPGKSAGGAFAAGAGGATGGAMIGAQTANPYGIAIGAAIGGAVGFASYLMS